MWYMHEGAGWWMLFGGFWMVVFWGVLIALAIWGIRKVIGTSKKHEESSPQDIARQRYARGEISRDEYEQLMKDLEVRR